MEFNVNRVLNQNSPTQKKETPVERMNRKNQEELPGMLVDHAKQTHLKTSDEADIEDAMEVLPDTLADMNQFGRRVRAAKLRLHLGEGGFVDQEFELINPVTMKPEGKAFMSSQQINQQFVMLEPKLSDEQLDEFLKTYFVEFDLKTGVVKPRKYPSKGLKSSVTFPPAAIAPDSDSIKDSDPELYKVKNPTQVGYQWMNQKEEEMDGSDGKDSVDDSRTHTGTKVKYKIEERMVGVRKKLGSEQLIQLHEMVLDRNSVPCTAIASRYKCDITAITYDEFDTLRRMFETSNLAKETKIWSLIYRHVKNPTIGEFQNFQDFCEKTAWVDRNRFWFALMCSMNTTPETTTFRCTNLVWRPIDQEDGTKYDLSNYQERYKGYNSTSALPTNKDDLESLEIYSIISLSEDEQYKYIPIIQNPATGLVKWIPVEQKVPCGVEYTYQYLNRSLLDTDNQPKWITAEAEKINTITSMQEALSYYEEGPLRSKRIIPINDAISIDVGVKSVADVLRNDYKYMLSDELVNTIKEMARKDLVELNGEGYTPTEDEIGNYVQNEMTDTDLVPVLGLCVIDKLVATINGEEYESNKDQEIIDTLSQCRPQDIAPLYNTDIPTTLTYRYRTSYEPSFSYKNCTCPDCGAKSNVPIEKVEDLVFTLSRSLETTTFDIEAL